MNVEDKGKYLLPQHFEFTGRVLTPVVGLLIVPVYFVGSLFWMMDSRGDSWGWGYTETTVIFFTIWIVLAYICVLEESSDVIVDESGLSRSLFGYVWLKFSWDEIGEIRVAKGVEGRFAMPLWVVRVYGFERSKMGMRPWKKRTQFFDKTDRMRLAEILTYHANKYGIPLFERNSVAEDRADRKFKPIQEIKFWYTEKDEKRLALTKVRYGVGKPKKIIPKSNVSDEKELHSSIQGNSSVMWLYCVGGIEHGPVDETTLRTAIINGEIKSFDTVKKVTDRFWSPVPEVLQKLGLSISDV